MFCDPTPGPDISVDVAVWAGPCRCTPNPQMLPLSSQSSISLQHAPAGFIHVCQSQGTPLGVQPQGTGRACDKAQTHTCFDTCADLMGLPLVLQVVRWASDYQATLQDLGIEEEDTRFPSKDKSGLALLMDKYIAGMRTTRQEWLQNIIKAWTPLQGRLNLPCPGLGSDGRLGLNRSRCWSPSCSRAAVSAALPAPGLQGGPGRGQGLQMQGLGAVQLHLQRASLRRAWGCLAVCVESGHS